MKRSIVCGSKQNRYVTPRLNPLQIGSDCNLCRSQRGEHHDGACLNPLQIGSDCNCRLFDRSMRRHVSIPFKSGLTVISSQWVEKLRSSGLNPLQIGSDCNLDMVGIFTEMSLNPLQIGSDCNSYRWPANAQKSVLRKSRVFLIAADAAENALFMPLKLPFFGSTYA